MLDHRKRGLAVLSTKKAGRANSRFGFAQTHSQEGNIARGRKTLATALDDVAFVLAAREIAQGCFAPLPAARHVALTSNEEALSAFLLAWTSYWDVVNARMDPLQSNSSASEPLVRTSKGVVHRSSALCFARLQSWRAPQQSLRVAIQNERFVGVATFAKRIEV